MPHTPGKWTVEQRIYDDRQKTFISSEYEHLAEILEFVPEHIANAHLIAAAPELLKALRTVEKRMALVCYSQTQIEMVREVIAKAEGSQP